MEGLALRRVQLAVAAAAVSVAIGGAAMADPVITPAGPASAPTPAAPPAPRSRQAAYDEGQAAYDAEKWDKAIADFTEVLAGVKDGRRSDAVIRIRLADSLLYASRLDEAETQARRAIAVLRALASGPDTDLADAYLTLGDALRLDLGYDEAVEDFKLAKANAAGPDAAEQTQEAEIGLVQASVVTQPDLAAAILDSMLADDATFKARPKEWRAQIYSLRARAELNRGDPEKALVFIKKALDLEGALTGPKISLFQVGVRGDAALIYSVLRQPDNTRKYLAYTGAGHLPDEDWLDGAVTDPPVCGPDIAPEDSAVVEFAIAADGRTAGVAPVWSSRPGETGIAFARAVREWQWRPEAVAKLDEFWRLSVRVELRCAERPPPLALDEPFEKTTRDWLASRGDAEELYDLGPKTLAAPGAAPPADMARITALYRQLSAENNSRKAAAETTELDALLVRAGAPVEARALAAEIGARGEGGGALVFWSSGRAAALSAALPRIDQAAGGQRSAAWLRVELAVALETVGDFGGARAPLEAVVALPPDVLAADDPIRSVAILHLSLLDRKAGNRLAAKTRLVAAGLTTQKCDLLDVKPIATDRFTSASDFPDEALRWGFEGWVKAGFDIGADGGVKGARALISYPPFVFDDATTHVVSGFRYLPPTLGDTALGCTGQTVTVKYRGPNFH